jgi:CRISPR-associated protein Csd1
VILQSLYSYYDRLRQQKESGIAAPGFAPQKVSYAVVIDRDGKLVDVQDIRDTSGKTPRAIEILVPEPVIRTVDVAANFLCDNTGYVFGIDDKGKPERTKRTCEAFRALQHEIGDSISDSAMQAVLRFLDSWNPKRRSAEVDWDQVSGSNMVFRIHKERIFVHEHPTIQKAWLKYRSASEDAQIGTCLVTGRETTIAPLHAKIKGVRDAQSTGAALVSFNLDAFCSYGKEQNYNAPIGTAAAFAYTTALNHLLRFDSKQRLQVGDATTIFWTERASVVEDFLGNILDPKNDSTVDAADSEEIANYLKEVRAGKKPAGVKDDSINFYILGLAPNASRISVRFWNAMSVKDVNINIGRHFADLRLIREYDDQAEFPGIWQLLREIVRRYRKGQKPIEGDMNALLSGAFFRSFIEGLPYPTTLLSSLLNRIHADGEVNYYRTALIKAMLRRNYKKEEVMMGLDEELKDVSYRLGRLFAVMEKAQVEAIWGDKAKPSEIGATIKDRFFGTASATPRVVFPQLLRLSQHHLAKIDVGSKINKEKLFQSIMDGVDAGKGFPAQLNLQEQGMFALGYYHQRKALFTKKESSEKQGQEE